MMTKADKKQNSVLIFFNHYLKKKTVEKYKKVNIRWRLLKYEACSLYIMFPSIVTGNLPARAPRAGPTLSHPTSAPSLPGFPQPLPFMMPSSPLGLQCPTRVSIISLVGVLMTYFLTN